MDVQSGDIGGVEDGLETQNTRIQNFAHRARPVDELYVDWVTPIEARKLNVIGRKAVGPVSGFGHYGRKPTGFNLMLVWRLPRLPSR